MTTINLKRYYPYMTENVMLEVSDEIAAALSMGGRLCDSYKRQKRRNGECSLDTDPGFEADVLRQPTTPDEYVEARETTLALYDALAQLPPTQARRVYQHYHQLTRAHKVLEAKQHGITVSSSFEIQPVFLHSSSLFCHTLWLLKLKDPKELVLRAIQGRGAQYYWM